MIEIEFTEWGMWFFAEKAVEQVYAYPKFPYWMNYHWRVFRAKDTTAKLTVKDVNNDNESNCHIGQELMYNFIEIQPYLDK